jgi:hypothetical protein
MLCQNQKKSPHLSSLTEKLNQEIRKLFVFSKRSIQKTPVFKQTLGEDTVI